MVTGWPVRELPGSRTSAERLAQSITAMSDGRLKVTVYPAGSLVRAFEVFDAASVPAPPTCIIRSTITFGASRRR